MGNFLGGLEGTPRPRQDLPRQGIIPWTLIEQTKALKGIIKNMSEKQEQGLNNPFKNLDKTQYRNARDERRPAPVKIKRPGKLHPAPDGDTEDNLFAGLMRDSGVTRLEKSGKKTPSVIPGRTAAPDTASCVETDGDTPVTPPVQKNMPTAATHAAPSGPAVSLPESRQFSQPATFWESENDETAPTLAQLGAFAKFKAKTQAQPAQPAKPAQVNKSAQHAKPAPQPTKMLKSAPLHKENAHSPQARQAAEPRNSVPASHPGQATIPFAWQEASQTAESDGDLFTLAMNGVHTLNGGGRAVPLPPPERPLPRPKTPGDPLRDFMDGKVEFSLEFTDEYLQGHIVGLDSQVINKMKAGEYSSEAHLDLHGLNAMQAWEALVGFFRSAYHKGLRCVLVVPGRGLNSPGGTGVLRERLQTWFTQAPFKYVILAFCTALPRHGGAGALYVLLRKQKKSRGKIHWDILPADADLLDG